MIAIYQITLFLLKTSILRKKKETKREKKTGRPIEKAKRITLTKGEKAELCHLRQKGFTQLVLAHKFGIGESTVSKILKNQSYWLSIDPKSTQAKTKRSRLSNFPILEEALSLWVSKAELHHQTLTGGIIRFKAFQFAERLHIDNFGGSEGWLSNFKKRFNIKEYKRQGEAASAPIGEIPSYRNELRNIIKVYNPRDVYNCDETALYWRVEPDKTLASGPVQGKKKSKDRATILITCNSTGDDKLPILFIYKYQNPRPLRHIDKANLPVYYFWNCSAWMQSISIYENLIIK